MQNTKSKKNVVIIDGYGFVFRAFFSLKDLKTKSGTPIGAVYGFINMLLRLFGSIPVDYIILTFDSGKKSFRSEIYKEYKANRAAAPEDLIPQFPIIREAATAFNIKFSEVEGFEADDLIATYATLCNEHGLNTIVVTSDKDLMQLVKDGEISIYDPIKAKFLKEIDVELKFGVKPWQITDYLSIVGDSSDNIPGVPGIGEKGAAELLKQFNTLEEIYENLELITKPKLRKALENGREKALLSKQLASLKFDVKVEPVEHFAKQPFQEATLFDFLTKYELNSIIAKLLPDYNKKQPDLFEAFASGAKTPSTQKTKNLIETEEAFESLLNSFQAKEEITIKTTENELIIEEGEEEFYISLK